METTLKVKELRTDQKITKEKTVKRTEKPFRNNWSNAEKWQTETETRREFLSNLYDDTKIRIQGEADIIKGNGFHMCYLDYFEDLKGWNFVLWTQWTENFKQTYNVALPSTFKI